MAMWLIPEMLPHVGENEGAFGYLPWNLLYIYFRICVPRCLYSLFYIYHLIMYLPRRVSAHGIEGHDPGSSQFGL